MSDHEYIPKSKVGKWFNDRLPLLTLGAHLADYPTPTKGIALKRFVITVAPQKLICPHGRT